MATINMILLYHYLIKDEDVDENLYRRSYEGAPLLYYRKESLFEEDMNRIITNIMLDEIPKEGVAITFDDGHIDNYTIAFPVLKMYGLRAHFFVPTAFIGKKGYCSWKQLKEMSDYGCRIESHTHNHVPLDDLEPVGVEYELNTSADLIQEKVGKRPKFLSLPAGRRFDTKIAKKCGYEGVRTSQRGFDTNPWDLEVVKMLNRSILKVE